jgi:hypothetical protein
VAFEAVGLADSVDGIGLVGAEIHGAGSATGTAD